MNCKQIVYAICLFVGFMLPVTSAQGAEYKYCVACDTHSAQTTVSSGSVDFGKEWYRVKSGMIFQKAYGAKGCSVSHYSAAQCGHLTNEELVFTSVDGDQITGLLSGNPVLIGQTLVEIIVGIPVSAYDWVMDWFD